MKNFLKTLIIPVVTYGVLRGGEAVVSGIASWRRKKAEEKTSDK